MIPLRMENSWIIARKLRSNSVMWAVLFAVGLASCSDRRDNSVADVCRHYVSEKLGQPKSLDFSSEDVSDTSGDTIITGGVVTRKIGGARVDAVYFCTFKNLGESSLTVSKVHVSSDI